MSRLPLTDPEPPREAGQACDPNPPADDKGLKKSEEKALTCMLCSALLCLRPALFRGQSATAAPSPKLIQYLSPFPRYLRFTSRVRLLSAQMFKDDQNQTVSGQRSNSSLGNSFKKSEKRKMIPPPPTPAC